MRIIKANEIGETRRAQRVARRKLGLASLARKLVPRADRKAVVAAEDAVAHRGTQFAGNRPFVLDGEVGNAPSCVELVRRRESRSWANIETCPATAAAVRFRGVSRQIERCEDRAEKQPGAELARDQVGVLALPSKSGMGGKRLLHDGRSVDEYFHVSAGVGGKPAREVLEFGFDQLVIVVALRVDRDRCAITWLSRSRADHHLARSSAPA